MAAGRKSPVDYISWARRVNAAWLVHGDLDSDAAAYMDYLAGIDPDRLNRSCKRAWQLVDSLGKLDDPKPWFYGGLFSLATAEEAARFLGDHPFLAAVVPSLAGDPDPPDLAEAGRETRDKIQMVRAKIAGLCGNCFDDSGKITGSGGRG